MYSSFLWIGVSLLRSVAINGKIQIESESPESNGFLFT